MAEQNLNERDGKLVQWLNEAHAKEAELEADLTAHISLTQKQSYKKRLQQHLKETRDHKRRVASRIRQLGGTATGPTVPGVPGAVGEAAGKAVAAVKGQVGVARAVITQQAETHLRNAQHACVGRAVDEPLGRVAHAREVGQRYARTVKRRQRYARKVKRRQRYAREVEQLRAHPLERFEPLERLVALDVAALSFNRA